MSGRAACVVMGRCRWFPVRPITPRSTTRPRLGMVLNERWIGFWNGLTVRPKGLDPLLRAGIAHLWLVTLHPFEDGNGRVSRAVTDLAVAQADRRSARWLNARSVMPFCAA